MSSSPSAVGGIPSAEGATIGKGFQGRVMKSGLLNPRVTKLLWGLAAAVMFVLPLPIGLYIVALATLLVAAFRWAGPISGMDVRHVAMGFVGWFVINTLLWIWLLDGDWRGDPWGLVRGFILLCVNILVLLVLSLGGRWITLGVFLWTLVNAIGTLLFIALGHIEYEGYFSFHLRPFFLSFFYPNL